MPSYKALWRGEKAAMECASDALAERLDPPADAISMRKEDPVLEDNDTAWFLEAYFSEPPDAGDLAALAGSAAEIEELEDRDWVAHALSGLGIVRAGRFVLYGVHDADKIGDAPEHIRIRIDANQAFGTGHHPTTAGCLEALESLADLAPRNVLDLGTGSAVLAIAAAKLWETQVLATDIDEPSIRIARENIALNDAQDSVRAEAADGFAHSEIAARAPFELILANILAGPLVELAPAMANNTAPEGVAVLAGLLAEQEADVRAAYEVVGFTVSARIVAHEAWPVLVLRRA